MARTHITFLIDRSGSMASQENGVREGFKSFVTEQKAVEGKCRLTVIQFDAEGGVGRGLFAPSTVPVINETLVDNVGIMKVDPVAALARFHPRGGTPLYDATALAIRQTDATIVQMTAAGKKPDHVLFIVFTDGQENSSKEQTYTTLSELVKAKESEGWTFTYLGANHDSYAQAGAAGFSVMNTQNYAGSDVGAQAAYATLSAATSNLRSTGISGVSVANFYEQTGKTAEDELEETSKANTTP